MLMLLDGLGVTLEQIIKMGAQTPHRQAQAASRHGRSRQERERARRMSRADRVREVWARYPPASESGQIVVDMWHPYVWRGVVAAYIINAVSGTAVHSLVLGDKDTYRIAFALANTNIKPLGKPLGKP